MQGAGIWDVLQRLKSGKRRPVLVILRAGDSSLHPKWLDNKLERNWDLHLSYYGDELDPFPDRPSDVTLTREKGTKSQGTVVCLEKLGDRLDDYDWIWLPDDDLSADCATLNRFFDIVMNNRFELSQPALGAGSVAGHDIVRQKPAFKWRYTSFVEVMCPCFSRSAFIKCRPYFGATMSSWGVDLLFAKILGYPRRGIAIVDETPVVHSRLGKEGNNIALVRAAGIEPVDECLRFLRTHDFPVDVWPYHTKLLREYAGVDLSGRLVSFDDE
jgi:hypothetical protein